MDSEMMEDTADVRRIQALTDQVWMYRRFLSDLPSIDKRIVCDGQIPTHVQEGVPFAERWPRALVIHRQRQLPV